MEKLHQLFQMLELTRNQPQYGYAIAGIAKGAQSDLAQHHYLVAMIALFLARGSVLEGAKINVQKVLEMALTHDLGELFGGDLNFYYSKAKPKARELAKAFEDENRKFVFSFIEQGAESFLKMSEEFENKSSDEGLLVQCADKMECTYYKVQVGAQIEADIVGIKKSLDSYVEKISDLKLKNYTKKVVDYWATVVEGDSFIETLSKDVQEYS